MTEISVTLAGVVCFWSVVFVTRHSLVRAKGEVLGLLYVFCLFVFCQRFLDNQRADSSQILHGGRTLVPDVSSPLLGVSGPRGAKKGGNETFVTIEVNGKFLQFGVF